MAYQFALIKMLHNTKTDTYHPIFYYDSPLPGPVEEQKVMRYKSKGHHTTGFQTRDVAYSDALLLKARMENELHDTVTIELEPEQDIQWDGEDMPIDVLLRDLPDTLKHFQQSKSQAGEERTTEEGTVNVPGPDDQQSGQSGSDRHVGSPEHEQ